MRRDLRRVVVWDWGGLAHGMERILVELVYISLVCIVFICTVRVQMARPLLTAFLRTY